jgi:hypothetical protein
MDVSRTVCQGVNNAPLTLFLTELIIRVTSSVIDKEPVITVGYETKDDLHIENFGWGKVLNPRLAFGIAPADKYDTLDPASLSTDQSLKLDSFDSFVAVPVADQILAFSKKRIEQQERELSSRSPGQTIKIVSMGERVCIYGTIAYDTEDANKRAVYFKTIVYTGYTLHRAGMTVPSATYGVVLLAGRAGYTKRIPISQYVKSGDADHLAVQLLTDRSAKFDMTLEVTTAGGTVVHSRNLLLETFVPSVGGRPLELKDSPRIKRDSAK